MNIINLGKLVATVVLSFNLNNIQEKQLNDYVKLKNYEWTEKRKNENEIMIELESKARNIKNS